VSPGEIAATTCSHSITSTPVALTAGVTYFFTLTTRDIHSNLIKIEMADTVIEVLAAYVDHNAWLSPLAGVSDLADWDRIYGRDIAGLAVFNNASASDLSSSYTC
jgi:hypothetical protein